MSSSAYRVAIVTAIWHADLLENLTASAIEQLTEAGAKTETIVAPGAFELPWLAKRSSSSYDAIIAAALVVNGGIYEHEHVANAVLNGLMQVQLDTGVPVLSAVLSPLAFHDSEDHHNFFAEHLKTKGREVADATLLTLDAHRIGARTEQ